VTKGRVTVKARSSADVTTWSKLSGTIQLDLDQPLGARAEMSVDMRAFEAGDWFKHWQLEGDMDPRAHPTATFMLMRFEGLREASAGQLEATAVGQLQWRGKTAEVRVRGTARVNPRAIDAAGWFELDARLLGLAADEPVRVEITLSATAG
jgi:hypothetical protein